jgi:hypothetical protein
MEDISSIAFNNTFVLYILLTKNIQKEIVKINK